MDAPQIPSEWDAAAHTLWKQGRFAEAIQATVESLNRHTGVKPVRLVLQFTYYLYLHGDPGSAAATLQIVRKDYPRDPELLANLAACLGKSRQYAQAVEVGRELAALRPDDAGNWDVMASALGTLGRTAEMREAGTRALVLKDAAAGVAPSDWTLPGSPQEYLEQRTGRDIIAFSMWGANPRYLRGAIDNALNAAVYPGWTLRYYVDSSVPQEIRDALTGLGAQVCLEPDGQPDRQRLAWRFKVANDPGVRRFLVRDVDSVINTREAHAVAEWIASPHWFHVMRDWHTHTDLILAGMWGGIAGVLPALDPLLAGYRSKMVETQNIDQWFLRDQVWRYLRGYCLIHDRLYALPGTRPWPDPDPDGNTHVGQDVYAAARTAQEARLRAWINRLPSLQGAGSTPTDATHR